MLTKHSLTTAGKLVVLTDCIIYLWVLLKGRSWLARVSLASHDLFTDLYF
jgi:hypothetical protein